MSSVFRVVFSLWFLLLVTEPAAAMHQCPLHDGAAAATTTAAHHAGHHAPASTDQSHKSHHCNCIGDCAASALTANFEQPVRMPVPASIAATRPIFPEVGIVAVWTQYVLPFQNGPPLA